MVNVLGPGYSLLFLLNRGLAVGGYRGCKETRGQYQQVIGVDDATFLPERKSFTAQHLASKPLEHVLTSIPVPHFPLCSRSSPHSLLPRPPAKPFVHSPGAAMLSSLYHSPLTQPSLEPQSQPLGFSEAPTHLSRSSGQKLLATDCWLIACMDIFSFHKW